MVALDLEDAYNPVQYAILMRRLVNIGATPAFLMWICNATLKRKVVMSMRLGTWASRDNLLLLSFFFLLIQGLPQDYTLSHNVYTDGITSNQLKGIGSTLSFADDGMVSCTVKCR